MTCKKASKYAFRSLFISTWNFFRYNIFNERVNKSKKKMPVTVIDANSLFVGRVKGSTGVLNRNPPEKNVVLKIK